MRAVRVRESIKRWKLEPTREIGNHLSRATQYCINHCPCVVCAIHTNDFACSGSNDFSVGALNVHVYSSSLIKKQCNRYRTYPCARYDFLPQVKWCSYLFELFITPERMGKRVLYDLDTWCCRLPIKRTLHDVFGNCTSKSIISCKGINELISWYSFPCSLHIRTHPVSKEVALGGWLSLQHISSSSKRSFW